MFWAMFWTTCKMRRCNTSNLHRVGAYTKHAASRRSNASRNSTHQACQPNPRRVGAHTKHAISRRSNIDDIQLYLDDLAKSRRSATAIVRNTKPAHTTASAPSAWPCTPSLHTHTHKPAHTPAKRNTNSAL
jgi:hypothetical protein